MTNSNGLTPLPWCPCGPGAWVSLPPVVQCVPARPQHDVQTVRMNNTRWMTTHTTNAEPGMALAHVSTSGFSYLWGSGSVADSALAMYRHSVREVWQGEGIPCARLVALTATGGGGLALALSCAAVPGCGASGAASISGSCSSAGNASAELQNKMIDGQVAYHAATSSTHVSGKFGPPVTDSSASIEGSISHQLSWRVFGSGDASGSATYTVRPDRTYCAFTNRAISREATGVASCSGSATVDENGSAAFNARAFVSLSVH